MELNEENLTGVLERMKTELEGLDQWREEEWQSDPNSEVIAEIDLARKQSRDLLEELEAALGELRAARRTGGTLSTGVCFLFEQFGFVVPKEVVPQKSPSSKTVPESLPSSNDQVVVPAGDAAAPDTGASEEVQYGGSNETLQESIRADQEELQKLLEHADDLVASPLKLLGLTPSEVEATNPSQNASSSNDTANGVAIESVRGHYDGIETSEHSVVEVRKTTTVEHTIHTSSSSAHHLQTSPIPTRDLTGKSASTPAESTVPPTDSVLNVETNTNASSEHVAHTTVDAETESNVDDVGVNKSADELVNSGSLQRDSAGQLTIDVKPTSPLAQSTATGSPAHSVHAAASPVAGAADQRPVPTTYLAGSGGLGDDEGRKELNRSSASLSRRSSLALSPSAEAAIDDFDRRSSLPPSLQPSPERMPELATAANLSSPAAARVEYTPVQEKKRTVDTITSTGSNRSRGSRISVAPALESGGRDEHGRRDTSVRTIHEYAEELITYKARVTDLVHELSVKSACLDEQAELIHELEERLSAAEGREESAKTRSSKMQAEHDSYEAAITELNTTLRRAKQAEGVHERELHETQSQMEILKEQIVAITKRNNMLEESGTALRKQLKASEETAHKLELQVEQVLSSSRKLESSLKEQSETDATRYEDEVKERDRILEEKERSISELHEQISNNLQSVQEKQEELQSLSSVVQKLRTDLQASQRQTAEKEARISTLEKEVESLRQGSASLQSNADNQSAQLLVQQKYIDDWAKQKSEEAAKLQAEAVNPSSGANAELVALLEELVEGDKSDLRRAYEDLKHEHESIVVRQDDQLRDLRAQLDLQKGLLKGNLFKLDDREAADAVRFAESGLMMFDDALYFEQQKRHWYQPKALHDPLDVAVCNVLRSVRCNVRVDCERLDDSGMYMLDRPVQLKLVNDQVFVKEGDHLHPLYRYIEALYAPFKDSYAERVMRNKDEFPRNPLLDGPSKKVAEDESFNASYMSSPRKVYDVLNDSDSQFSSPRGDNLSQVAESPSETAKPKRSTRQITPQRVPVTRPTAHASPSGEKTAAEVARSRLRGAGHKTSHRRDGQPLPKSIHVTRANTSRSSVASRSSSRGSPAEKKLSSRVHPAGKVKVLDRSGSSTSSAYDDDDPRIQELKRRALRAQMKMYGRK